MCWKPVLLFFSYPLRRDNRRTNRTCPFFPISYRFPFHARASHTTHMQPASASARSVLLLPQPLHRRNSRPSSILSERNMSTMNGSSDFVTSVSATPAEVEDLLSYVLEQVRCQNIVCGRMTRKTKVDLDQFLVCSRQNDLLYSLCTCRLSTLCILPSWRSCWG